jgi:hypothetical protein
VIEEKELDIWIESHIAVAEKWEAEEEIDWKQRARRAEAEREAARTIAYSATHQFDARVVPLEEELEELTSSLSWRLTEPLRRLNGARRR